MSLIWTKTFDHAGRAFEVRAETYADPSYLEAVVFEDGRLVEWPFAGGQRGLATIGVTFPEQVGPKHAAAAEDLMAVAEAELRRRLDGDGQVAHALEGT